MFNISRFRHDQTNVCLFRLFKNVVPDDKTELVNERTFFVTWTRGLNTRTTLSVAELPQTGAVKVI